jgi:hypothetical protein
MSSDSLAMEFVKSRAKRASDVKTREVITAQPETPLREIANLMEKHSIKRVPIVRDELVVGIVSRANLLQVLARANENTDWVESDRVLPQRFVDSISRERADPSTSSSMTAAPISGDLSTAWTRRPPFALRPRQRQERVGIGSFGHRIPNFRDLTKCTRVTPIYPKCGAQENQGASSTCKSLEPQLCQQLP